MMDMKAIICLAALSANAAALPHAAPDALSGPLENRAADAQLLPLSLPSVTATPTPALSLASPSNVLGQLTSILGAGSVTIPEPTGITLPKDILTPATNAYLQDPVASMKLMFASMLNALQSGNTGALGQMANLLSPLKVFSPLLGTTGQVAKRQDDPEDVTDQEDSPDVTNDVDSPDDEETDSPDSEDTDSPDSEDTDSPDNEDSTDNEDIDSTDEEDIDSLDDEDPDSPDNEDVDSTDNEDDSTDDQDIDSTGIPSDEIPADDAPTDDAPTDDAPTDDAPTDDAPTDDAPTDDAPTDDAPTDDAPTDDAPTDDAPTDDAPADDSATEDATVTLMKRQLAVPSAALVPSGVSDSVALPGSFQPLADATPLAAVPASLAALNLNGGVASAVVPSALISALADPTINTLAVVNSLDPLAPIPTALIPPTAAAAVAAAASALAPPVKRDVQAKDAQNLPDPAALLAQWIAAQAKPLLNEINNQIQAAPSVAANIAAAQASLAAAPASIAAAQIAAIPSNAAPVLSAANSIVEDLKTGSVPNPVASILPDASALASAIVPVVPVQATATASATLADGGPAVAASVGAQVPNFVSVGQGVGVYPVNGGLAPLPTVYPVVGDLPKYEGQPAGTNIVFDPLTQPLSPDNVSSLLKNQLYLQLAPLLLIFQSLVAASNPSFTLSSLLLSSPLVQDRGLLLSSPSLSSSPDPTSPAIDPIASAWLEGAKLLQSNSLVNTRVLKGASSQPDLLGSLLSGSSALPSTTDVLDSLLDNPLNQKLMAKLTALMKWSFDTQLKAQDALEELLAVLFS
ncbi:hypothetical protein GTA08_BOTSDO03307 [Neofusicoccum parvum]|uniref:Uncharacterized protein n=1 Tax=Neofusicoccum parvum TaxID=310453 RepID=A0ACB5RY61_9PEZI|nr:hypothetical protein GTA08_BOTSDO03307 [Neofusicoccum parvum]